MNTSLVAIPLTEVSAFCYPIPPTCRRAPEVAIPLTEVSAFCYDEAYEGNVLIWVVAIPLTEVSAFCCRVP